jgi:hypothetical protein
MPQNKYPPTDGEGGAVGPLLAGCACAVAAPLRCACTVLSSALLSEVRYALHCMTGISAAQSVALDGRPPFAFTAVAGVQSCLW